MSLLNVHVVLRLNTSISPDCKAVKRSLALRLRNCTASGLSNIAAAIARQISTSSPEYLPSLFTKLNPGNSPLTPQTNLPRLSTVLRRLVLPTVAWFGSGIGSQAARVKTHKPANNKAIAFCQNAL